MKRLVSLFIVLALMVGAVPLAFASQPITITYAHFSAGESQEATLRQMIAIFEAKNPDVKVDARAVGYGEHFTQLATQIAANNAPDCFELNMENFLAFVVRGAVLELGGLFESTKFDKSVYSQGVLNACSMDGKLYAIPMSYSTTVELYNKTLFDKAGVAYPTYDWTVDDELKAAQAITALGIEDTYGMFQEIQYWEFYKTIKAFGGSMLSEDGKTFTLNSPENAQALQYMVDRVRVYHVMPTQEQLAGRGNVDLFIEGKLGILRCGLWNFADIAKRATGFEWDISVEPGFKEKATFFFANVGCISRTADAAKQDAAFRFLNAMGSDPEIVQLRLASQWELPVVADEAMMAGYLKVTPPNNKIAVLDSMDYAVTPPALEEFGYAVEILNPLLVGLESTDLTAQQLLDQAQSELESAIDLK